MSSSFFDAFVSVQRSPVRLTSHASIIVTPAEMKLSPDPRGRMSACSRHCQWLDYKDISELSMHELKLLSGQISMLMTRIALYTVVR